ncbi:MAG: hypothetical protein ACLS3M_13565 [Collinsella sp.]
MSGTDSPAASAASQATTSRSSSANAMNSSYVGSAPLGAPGGAWGTPFRYQLAYVRARDIAAAARA